MASVGRGPRWEVMSGMDAAPPAKASTKRTPITADRVNRRD
jgi:hypothetical protein